MGRLECPGYNARARALMRASACLMVAILLAAPEPVFARQTTSPTTQPVAQGLITWTEKERFLLDAVRDETASPDETGFYMMLKKVSRLPALKAEQWETLDRPSMQNLLRNPKRYRGEPIRLSVRVFVVRKLLTGPNKGLTATRWWTKEDGAVWELHCVNAPGKIRPDESLRVFWPSTAEPTFLGEPDEVRPDGGKIYSGTGRAVEVAGVFYKLCTTRDRDGRFRNFPVVVAWQLSKAATSPAASRTPAWVTILIAILFVLGMLFIYLKRVTRRYREAGAEAEAKKVAYKPLRAMAETGDEHKGPPPLPEEQDEAAAAVDPELRAAAEQYRRERHLDDGNDAAEDRG